MAAGSHFVKNFLKKLKLHIDLKWPEMRLKVNFGHPIWLTAAILSKKKKIKVAYRSEMARNEIKSDLRTSKMTASGHFVKNLNKNKVPYGSEMARNAIESEFRTPKMADQSEMARNAIQTDFQTSKRAARKKNSVSI